MRVLREVERNLAAGLIENYDVEAMGARGLIYTCSRDEGTSFQIFATLFAADGGQRLVRYVPTGGGAIEETVSFGIPIVAQNLEFNWAGAGIRSARLSFFDEPIGPYGRVPIRRWNGALAAASSIVLVTTEFLGLFQTLQLVTQGDQEYQYNLGYQNGNLSQTLTGVINIATTTGGFGLSALLPCPRQYSLTLVNNDAINVLNYSGVLFGFF